MSRNFYNVENYKMLRLKFLLKSIQTGGTPSTNNDDYFDGDIKWFTPGDFDENIYLTHSNRRITDHAILDNEAKLFEGNTVAIVGIGATLGKVGILKEEGSFNQQITGLNTNHLIEPEYLYYWILINRDTILKTANYTTLPIINNQFIKEFECPVPHIVVQKHIVNYLKTKSNEIFSIIGAKQKLINLLEQQRQSIITEAVTKGLNLNVKMKDSGIEWIGEIPEHWDVTKIKYTTYVKGRIGWQGLKSDEFIDEGPFLVTGTDFKNGYVDWDTCYHISAERYDEAPPIQLKEDDLLITKDGTIGKLALVKNMPYKAILNSGVFVTRPLTNKYNSKYMYWLLSSTIFDKYIKFMETGTTIKHLYQETFVNFSYPLPNIKEQEQITNYLDIKIAELDEMKLKINEQIEKLKEYRQSLIYEAVTGKIDVRELELD